MREHEPPRGGRRAEPPRRAAGGARTRVTTPGCSSSSAPPATGRSPNESAARAREQALARQPSDDPFGLGGWRLRRGASSAACSAAGWARLPGLPRVASPGPKGFPGAGPAGPLPSPMPGPKGFPSVGPAPSSDARQGRVPGAWAPQRLSPGKGGTPGHGPCGSSVTGQGRAAGHGHRAGSRRRDAPPWQPRLRRHDAPEPAEPAGRAPRSGRDLRPAHATRRAQVPEGGGAHGRRRRRCADADRALGWWEGPAPGTGPAAAPGPGGSKFPAPGHSPAPAGPASKSPARHVPCGGRRPGPGRRRSSRRACSPRPGRRAGPGRRRSSRPGMFPGAGAGTRAGPGPAAKFPPGMFPGRARRVPPHPAASFPSPLRPEPTTRSARAACGRRTRARSRAGSTR